MLATSRMWLFFSMLGAAVAAPTRTATRRTPLEASANSALETPAERELRNLFGRPHKTISDEVQEEEKRKLNMKAWHHQYRLQKSLEGAVPEVGSRELQKLDQVFKDDENHVSPNHHFSDHESHMRKNHALRMVRKLARRNELRNKQQSLHKDSPNKGKLLPTQKQKNGYIDADACDRRVSSSELGLRPGVAVLLQGKPIERPYAKPGIGANQTLKDEGRSKMGKIHDGEKFVEPFVTVYKDGFWLIGCMKDVMFEKAEKYGANRHKYNKNLVNISVAVYGDLVLKEKQKPMTPQVCFEFCRGFKGMGFFGISGRSCYCTPYYDQTVEGVGTDDTCDTPCMGDDAQICGGVKKFSIFEMHLCGDRGQQLSKKAEAAALSLSSFYAVALFIEKVSKDLQASGALLQEIAGLGGDPESSDYGQDAKVFSGDVEHVMMDGNCAEDYNGLLMNYEESETISFSDMTKAENMAKADEATSAIIAGIPKVDKCAKMASEVLLKGYPPFEDAIEAESSDAMTNNEEDYARSVATVHPLIYILKSSEKPVMSSCQGELLGKPMVSTMSECARTCEDMVHPEVCVGFQFYHLGGHEDAGGSEDFMQPLCFLFKSFKSITLYSKCDFFEDMTKDYEKSLKKKSLLQEEPKKLKETSCGTIEKVLLYTGMTCKQMFGTSSSILETCSKACKRTKAALLSAVCMAKVSEIGAGTPNIEIKNKKRCFGGARNKEVDSPEGAETHFLPFDDEGLVLAGDARVGSVEILEPIIWTGAKEE